MRSWFAQPIAVTRGLVLITVLVAMGLLFWNTAMLHGMWATLDGIDAQVAGLRLQAMRHRAPAILTQQQVKEITELAPFLEGHTFTAAEARQCVWNWKNSCGEENREQNWQGGLRYGWLLFATIEGKPWFRWYVTNEACMTALQRDLAQPAIDDSVCVNLDLLPTTFPGKT